MAVKSSLRDDRLSISALHPFSDGSLQDIPPRNLRNASISSKSSRTEWKNPATPIPIPSNNMNPFTGGRFKDTLNGSKSSSGTKKNQRTPTERPAKRQKTNHKPLLAKEPQPDISYVEIDDDEDDQPVAGPSSYQSAFKQGPASRIEVSKGRGSTDKEPVPISSEEEDVQASVPPDGRHSRWLKEKIKPKPSSPSHSSQTSIIDDFSEPELKESSKPGFVRAQVKKIEGKRVDLNKVVNVRNGMKPKLQPLKFNTVETRADPIATAPTTFLRKGFKSLPLKALYIGYNRLEGGYLLDFKPPPNRQTPLRHFTIIGPGKYKEDVTFAQVVKSMEFGSRDVQPCIRFSTKPLPPNQRHKGIGKDLEGDTFTPGELGIGHVTLKFDTGNPDWSEEAYKEFGDLCRRTLQGEFSEAFGPGANRALWSTAEQASGVDGETFVEEDSLNIRDESFKDDESFKADESFVYDELPVSDERNRKDEELPSRRAPKATYTNRQSSARSENNASAPRRSTRQQQQQQPAPAQAKKQPSEDPDEIILSYPPATPGALNITNADYNRLLPNEYLNDTLIEFGLRLWHNELAAENPDLAAQIHIFNSFFYKKLNKKDSDEGYQSVRRWTSKFDIFEKKFLVVPINENYATVCIGISPSYIVQALFSLPPPPPRELPNTRARLSNAHEEPVPDLTALPPSDNLPVSPSGENSSSTSNEATVGSPKPGSAAGSRAASPVSESFTGNNTHSSEADAEEVQGLANIEDMSVDEQVKLTDMTISVDVKDLNNDQTLGPPSPGSLFSESDAMDVDDKSEEKVPRPSYSLLTTSPHDPRTGLRPMNVDRRQSPESPTERRSIDVEDANLREPKSSKVITPVAAASFYAPPAQPPRKGKEKAEVIDDDADTLDSSLHDNQSASAAMIFTLDSLGGKHPKVGNVLSKYLQAEAKDKKTIENPSPALYKNLAVPTQPNFCDCGIYLIHFAQVFVKKAQYFHSLSQKKGPRSSSERQNDWEAQQLNGFRKELRLKVGALSKSWKAQRTAEQQEREKETEVSNEGEADVDIVVKTPPQTKKKGRASRQRG
ncbi:hypothetical protein BT96DRAFT_923228 [Gymnopus androsaceus JB14]|uniref:Ubiquitin-like protease family profile domain-containing protein n=1 Tax=Gymnopus androsaceus JB14 TaxID=1447944 RepID=A0A6A4HC79_9AGAR|nr:hypothetical protein BT96DRAFT_923228 [Gymnopus androsaceus JB14]